MTRPMLTSKALQSTKKLSVFQPAIMHESLTNCTQRYSRIGSSLPNHDEPNETNSHVDAANKKCEVDTEPERSLYVQCRHDKPWKNKHCSR
jgi:hypothetical protein